MARSETQAFRLEAAANKIGLRPLQRITAVLEIVRLARAGKNEDQIAASLRRRKVGGFDWSKIDLEKILAFVKLILAMFGL
jgi:citrate lyase synthetase